MRVATMLLLFTALSAPASRADDQRVSSGISWNGESNLVASPVDPSHLAVGWMTKVGGRVTLATSRSADGGATWSAPVLLPHNGSGHESGDPTFVWRPNDTLVAGYLDFDNTTYADGGLYVCRSGDGGASWDAPSLAIAIASADRPADRPWLVFDESGGPHAGRLYATSMKLKSGARPYRLYLAWSDDDGRTWSPQRTVDDSIPVGADMHAMCVPAVTASGVLLMAYLSYDPGSSALPRYVVVSSADGGATLVSHVATVLPASAAGTPTDTLYQYSYHLAAHPRDGSRVVLAWTDARNGDPDIYRVWSGDGGTSWSAPARVNDDATGNGAGQDMVWGAWAPGGAYALAWRDRRDGGPGQQAPFRIYAARSPDGGASFEPNVVVSSGSSPGITLIAGNDFVGIAHSDTSITCTWADARLSAIALQLYADHARLSPVPLAVGPRTYSSAELRVLESPSRASIAVQVVGGSAGTTVLSLWDVGGRRIATSAHITGPGGSTRIDLPATGLRSGVYLVSAEVGGRTLVKRVVLLR